MPNVLLSVKPTYQSVARYAAHNVVENIKRMTGIPAAVPVFYADSQGKFIQPGSAVSQDKDVLLSQDERLNIYVQESYSPEAIINTPVRHDEERLVFFDPALGVFLKPIYSYTDVVITVNFKAKNRLEIEAWRDMIKVQMGNNRQSHLHELDFHYPVPKEAIVIIHEIYNKREAVAGYNQTFGQYLKAHFSKEATALTTMAGTEPLLVIKQKQIGVQGWFEFEEPVEANKDDDGPAWTISFTYKFAYQKPVAANFGYPIIVHNQLISPNFFTPKPKYALNTRPHYNGMFLNAAEAIDSRSELAESTIGGIRMPDWDEWLPTQIPVNTSTVITTIAIVSPKAPTYLGDLMEIEWLWQPAFEKFFKSEAEHVHIRGESMIYVNLYADQLPLPDATIRVDDKLVVTAVESLDLRRTYRLRVALVTDIRLLSNRAISAMQEHGLVTLLMFQTLMPSLDMEDGTKHILADGSLKRSYIEKFFVMYRNLITGGSWDGPGNRDAGGRDVEVNRIMFLSIVAKRREGNS